MCVKHTNANALWVLGRFQLFAGFLAAVAVIFCSLGAGANAASLGPGFNVLAMVPLPSNASGTAAVNEVLNKFYSSGGGQAGDEHVVVVDGMTFAQIDVGSGSDANIDSRTDTYWSATVYNGGVVVRDGNTNNVITTLPLGDCPIETSYDYWLNRMWVGAQCGNQNDPVFAVDARTFHVVAGPIGTGGVMGPIIADGADGSGRVYITNSKGSLRVNPTTFAVTKNAFGSVMAIDTGDNRLYAAAGNNLQIINGVPDPEVILATIPLTYTPASMGINQELNHLYVANPAGKSIEVRGGTSGRLISTFSLAAYGAIPDGGLAVDNIRGRIYLTATTGSGRSLLVIEDLITARDSRANKG
jgi:hypothetical protein